MNVGLLCSDVNFQLGKWSKPYPVTFVIYFLFPKGKHPVKWLTLNLENKEWRRGTETMIFFPLRHSYCAWNLGYGHINTMSNLLIELEPAT